MTIPFKDLTDGENPRAAGYLKILPRAKGDIWLGALFVMDERGEPVEFTHARIRAPKTLLWRADDVADYCVRSMCTSMFDVCPAAPLILLCLADEVGLDIFTKDISVGLPVGRLSSDDAHVEWTANPETGSPQERLFDALAARGLLMEPFERAEIGLREVYSDLLKRPS